MSVGEDHVDKTQKNQSDADKIGGLITSVSDYADVIYSQIR